MQKTVFIIIALVASVAIGVFALLTAIRLTTQQPVAPTVPQTKPQASEPTTVPPNTCRVEFALNPTPTPSSGPSSTPTLTPSPTPKNNVAPKCTSLSASPTSGDAPLLVTFVASGYDNNDGYVAGFEFTFGDGESKKIEQTFNTNDSYTIEHSYTKVGTYIASVRVKDNNGTWSDVPEVCKQTITARGTGPTVTQTPQLSPTTVAQVIPSPTTEAAIPKVPQAGNFIPTILSVVGGALILAVGVLAL